MRLFLISFDGAIAIPDMYASSLGTLLFFALCDIQIFFPLII